MGYRLYLQIKTEAEEYYANLLALYISFSESCYTQRIKIYAGKCLAFHFCPLMCFTSATKMEYQPEW